MSTPSRSIANRTIGGMSLRTFLAIVCGFWLYATVSAVLYAYAVDANISRETGMSVFAPWRPRVVQYLLLLLPLVGCYAVSLRIGWQPLWRRLPAQLALGIGFALLARPALMLAVHLTGIEEHRDDETWMPWGDWIGPVILSWLAAFSDFLVRYGFGLALVTGFALYKQSRDTELRVTAIGRELDAARLAALRMQLSPHTLFNLLHTIRGQIAWDPAAAQTMVVQLADLLRRLLNAGERDYARLTDEIHFVRLYLELQRSRFADRLSVTLPDSETLPDVRVPSLILQPLVENAVTHGLEGHDGPVEVEIAVVADDDTVRISITNTRSDAADATSNGGVGLRNVRERLAVHFGRSARLDAGPRADGRWQATVSLPRLEAAS
jgi:hypothetical protein